MKSENHLIITGIVISDVAVNPGQIHFRFRIIHNYGGGRPPLTLNCVQIVRPGTEPKIPPEGGCCPGPRIPAHSYGKNRGSREIDCHRQ